MNKHLTEQQLIDYQFKLADAADLNQARTHLGQCEQCRRKLEKLARKFAALDLLRGEVKAPEDLLSRTVEQIVQPRRSRAIWLYRVPALGAVAAAVIAGAALLLVSNDRPTNKMVATATRDLPAQDSAAAPARNETQVAKSLLPESPGPGEVGKAGLAGQSKSVPFDMGLTAVQSSPMNETATPARSETQVAKSLLPEAAGLGGVGRAELAGRSKSVPFDMDLTAARSGPTSEAVEPPPFAPASAIELVVLPRRENVQLTIYNGADLTLVRERRNLTLKKGWNWLQFMWANTLIDPTSLALEPLEHTDAVQVQQLVFPPRLRELGRWLIHSDIDGQVPFELTYFTSGLAWRAFYMGTLSQDEKTMRLESYVRIGNGSGEDYEDAQTRLLVGRVHLLDQIAELAKRPYPYGSPVSPGAQGWMGGLGGARADKDSYALDVSSRRAGQLTQSLKRKEIQKEGLSEYFLYTIEGTETIPNQWGKRLLSFKTDEIPVTSLYKYDEERWGTGTVQFLAFANDKEHKLGETPLPDGTVRIYGRADEQGHLSYVGAMEVKYIPVGEKVELNLGPARLVEVKPVLMDSRTENHTFDNKGNVSGWDDVQTWKIEIANTRPLPVEVEVTRGFGTPSWTLKPANEEVPCEKYDATHARFKLAVEPRSKRIFEYTVTTYQGVRREVLSSGQ